MASVAHTAERKKRTENVFHMLLRWCTLRSCNKNSIFPTYLIRHNPLNLKKFHEDWILCYLAEVLFKFRKKNFKIVKKFLKIPAFIIMKEKKIPDYFANKLFFLQIVDIFWDYFYAKWIFYTVDFYLIGKYSKLILYNRKTMKYNKKWKIAFFTQIIITFLFLNTFT